MNPSEAERSELPATGVRPPEDRETMHDLAERLKAQYEQMHMPKNFTGYHYGKLNEGEYAITIDDENGEHFWVVDYYVAPWLLHHFASSGIQPTTEQPREQKAISDFVEQIMVCSTHVLMMLSE